MKEITKINKSRIDWLDLLKGLAILWLIVYHFYVFDWMFSPVPIFFWVSGIFYKDYDSFGLFVKKKTKALIIPFLFFFALGYLTRCVSYLINGQTDLILNGGGILRLFTLIPSTSVHKNPLGVGAIWFLLSLFEINMFYYMIRKVTKNTFVLLVISVGCLIASSFFLQNWAMGSLAYSINSLQFVIYFVIGHLFKKIWLNFDQYLWLLAVACVLCMTKFISIEYINWGILFSDIRDKLFCIGVIILFIYLTTKISSISKKFCFKYFIQFLKYEGENSLTILGTHLLAMSVVLIFLRHVPLGLAYYPVLFVLICAICNVCIILFNKYIPFFINKR